MTLMNKEEVERLRALSPRDRYIATAHLDLFEQLANALDQLEKARSALEPFAEAVENLDDAHRDSSSIWESSAAMSITAGDLRRARAAHEGKE